MVSRVEGVGIGVSGFMVCGLGFQGLGFRGWGSGMGYGPRPSSGAPGRCILFGRYSVRAIPGCRSLQPEKCLN